MRDEPREILRTRNNFRYADELWQEAVDLWRTNGATDASVLQVIWPQNTYHSGPQYLHMVLDITPNFPWFPVLVSIFVRLGREPPRRIELQSWQVPRTMSVRHLAALVGFSGFLTDHVEDVYVAYGTTRLNGVEAMIQTQRGGHYELFLQTASLNTFIIAVARQLHLRDLEPAGDTSTNQEMTSVHEEEEEEDSLLQVSNSPIVETQAPWDTVLMARNDGDALDDDLTLVQTSLVISVVVHIAESSFTEIFLERVWPMTEDGERQLAMDTDVVQLRTDWSRVRSVYGIPRPVDVATFIISRPFEIGSRAPGLQLSIARFDDPLSVPEEIMSHWPELRNGEWRIFPGHESLRSARTVDVDGWHFALLTPQFNNYPNFAAGFIEVVSRFQEDEHSVLLTVVLPVRSTWTHLWSWLRLGDLYFGRNLFQVFHNGVPQTMTHLAYSLSHGFFIQIVAHAYTETDFAPIPGARIRSWMRDFRLTSPSQYGYVFRAGASIDDTLCVRLPRQDRDWEILQQWPDLTVWTSHAEQTLLREIVDHPWSPDDDVHIVQSHPDGTNVPILCSVYEGGGAVDYAIVIYRYSSIFALHQILRCAARCASEEYECHTHHNGILIPPHEILNLDEGDYLEVFLLAKSSNAHPLSQAVGDTHPVDQHSGTTATSTWSLVGLSSPGGDIGCRPDLVSWLNNADRDMFCGANTSSPRQSMYTRSFVIFRHALWTSCIHPMLTGDPSLVHSPPHLELDLSQKITSYVPLCSEMTIEIAVSTQERIDRRLGFDVVQDVTSHVLDRWCKSRQVLHRAQFSGQLEDEVDHLSLMQIGSVTPPTVSSIPTTVSVRLVGLRGLSARVEVDPTLTLSEQMEAVWPFNHVSPDAVYMYHPVSEPPAYTSEPQEQLFIVQLQNDHFSQIHEDDVLTLVIIRFLAPNAPFDNSKQRARVLWTPSQATRTSLLQFLRANWICRRPTTLCHVFVNRVLWPEMDTASRSIEPGDYIRLQVKTERAQFCDLILAETNARRQRIWESSSEESQPPDDFASEESESEEQSRYPRRSRSRSRERPRRNQRGDSSSLLQVSMIRLNKRTLDDYPQKDFDAIAAFDDICETSSHPIAIATLLRTTFSTTSDSPLWRLATPKIAWVFAVLQVRVLTCLSTLAGSASCWHSHPSFSNTDVTEDGNGPVHWLGVVPEALFGGSYSGYVLERQYMRSLSHISWYAPCASGDPPIWDVDAIFAELPSCDIRTDCWIRDYPNCPWNGNRAHLDDNEAPIFGIGDMRPDACGQPCAVHGKVLPYYLSLNASFAYLRPPGNGPGNVDLETLDDIIYLGQFQIVVDYRGPEPVHDPDPRHPHHNDGVEVPDEASSTFLNLVHGDCRSQAVDELPDLPWHETTQNLLEARATFGDIPLTEDVYIYTDGSAGTLYNGQEYEYYPWATWAFVIWWKQPQGWRILAYDFGHVTNDVNDPSWTGANQLTSAEGERAALLAAVCCLLRSGIHGLLHFYFDATAAGFGASGQWHSPPNAKDAKLLRAAMQLLEITQQEAPTFNHVKAHTGDAMNEMVDTLAYNAYINAIANPVLDFDVRSVLKGTRMYCELWPLILMAARSDSRFPSWESNTGSLHWSTHTKPPRADIVWASQDDHDCRTTVSREIRLVTYNVRTLGDGVGMAAMLRRQFASQEIDIACLQETRAKRSQIISSQDYTRFISKADEEGRGGVEIWVRKFGGEKKPLITGHNYLILGVNPEWLLLQLQIEGTTLHVASAHAPHSGHQAEEHETWWKNFTDAIITKIGIAPLIVGIDANSNFTESIDGTVGGLGVHWRSNKGLPHFTAFLKDVDMWIPATYTECHYGPTGTWRHPATGQWHRNDYLAISHCLQARECMTWVDGNIDCGGANVDHLAVVLQFQWEVVLKARTVKKNKRIDTLAMRHAGPERLAAALASVPVLPWDLNIHEHAAIFGDALREALAMAFPCSRKPPYRECISEEAWGLRGRRCQVRRRIYYRHGVEKRSDLGTAFSVLKGTANYDVLRRAGLRWELQCILADMRDRLQLRTLNHALKQQLKKDRTKYCDEIAASCESLPPSQVLQRLHAIGVRGKARRKNATETVTMKDEHGREVLSIDELNVLWRRHFEGLEDGFLIQKDELLQQCFDAQQKRPVPKPAFAEIPTLSDLETALRLNKWGKSAAFDNLPTDACHKFPQLIARVAYPLLVKQALMIAEPIGYKGGVLVHAFKGIGAASQCSNYRALMISSVMAKANHRILRSDLIGKFERYALPLQVGGLPGRAVAQGALCLVAFGSACRQQGKSSAVLFVDVRQAFYRMLRSHVVDIKRLDESVARLFQTLRLPKTSFADFAHELTHDSAVQQAEISEFLQAHLTESVSHTWFRLPNDPRISQTRKGSRPGDNLADLLFSFSFRRILAAVVQQLGEQGIDLSFESCGRAHPFPAQGPQEEDIRFHTLGPVWADDLAVFVWSEEACSLLDKTATVAASLFDALALRGMDVNFEAGKTEIVAHFTGKLAHSVKREVYRHKEPVLEVTTQWLDKVYVRIVPTYKHLGTVFSTAGRMKAEIRQRLGHARHEFRRFRKQVYANPLLEINKRIALFSSLVLSGLLFDISIWPRLDVRDEKIFDQGLNSLYRSLAYALWGDEVFQWRNERMRAKLGLSTSSTLLRTARLRHLQHLCTKGDKYVWAFVHLDGDWLRMIQDDLEWMRKQIPLRVPQRRNGSRGVMTWIWDGVGVTMSDKLNSMKIYRGPNAATGLNGTDKS